MSDITDIPATRLLDPSVIDIPTTSTAASARVDSLMVRRFETLPLVAKARG